MSRGRVLVVDDEPQNRRLFGTLLVREGYTVESAQDGTEALDRIERHPPDLVLLDVQMPGVNGFEVCRRLKTEARTRLIPVVLVTGLTAREDRLLGIDAGADDFLSKPVDREELRVRVSSLLRVKRYTDQLESAEAIILEPGADHRGARRLHAGTLRASGVLRDDVGQEPEPRRSRARRAPPRCVSPRHRQDRYSRRGAAQDQRVDVRPNTS